MKFSIFFNNEIHDFEARYEFVFWVKIGIIVDFVFDWIISLGRVMAACLKLFCLSCCLN